MRIPQATHTRTHAHKLFKIKKETHIKSDDDDDDDDGLNMCVRLTGWLTVQHPNHTKRYRVESYVSYIYSTPHIRTAEYADMRYECYIIYTHGTEMQKNLSYKLSRVEH